MAEMNQLDNELPDANMEDYETMGQTTKGTEEPENQSPIADFVHLKGLMSEKKLKADGQPPKRRGPKPDSKPALTRRQELNRQAQRTHRERKEQYIKLLEQEVFRLKEIYGQACRERNVWKDENQKLRDLLTANDIVVPEELTKSTQALETESVGNASVVGNADTSKNNSTPKSGSTSLENDPDASVLSPKEAPLQLPPGQQFEYDQVGIEFVLALEQPCMDHTQMLCTESTTPGGTISGHALMATCPPASHLHDHPDVHYPHKMPDMKPSDLRRLLDLSNRLPLDGEVTPVMAWARIMKDSRVHLLTTKDIVEIKDELKGKIRCYGFGAVVEEFEVRDAIEAVLTPRKDLDHSGPGTQSLQSAMTPASPAVAVSG